MNNSSTIASDCPSNNSSNISKLRRLKIQQNVLSANLQQSLCSLQEYFGDINNNDNNIKLNKCILKLKESYNEIKFLYEEIKTRTNVTGNLDKFDINEIKSDILKLETKIRFFKDHLRNELMSAQTEEEMLMSKLNETSILETKNIGRKQNKVNTFNQIVPSPVRAIIHSPFKCTEVHNYQEFLKSSVNRHGGWNEYNHSMFVQIWNKYYKDNIVKSIDKLPQFDEFKHEILQKYPEINTEDVIVHSNWYCQYVFLKIQQQNALNKWQENKRKIRKREPKPASKKPTIGPVTVSQRICKKTQANIKESKTTGTEQSQTYARNENLRKKDYPNTLLSCVLKPTRQWINRCQYEEKNETNLNIENISKLRTPNWRLSLQ